MLTMMMSIAHRISGAANAVGFLLLVWWLLAIASGPEAYAQVSSFFAGIPGRLLLFLFSWSLIHHMLGGIRHLIWDTGRGLDKVSIEIFALATIIGSTVLTVWCGSPAIGCGGITPWRHRSSAFAASAPPVTAPRPSGASA